MFAVYHLQTI